MLGISLLFVLPIASRMASATALNADSDLELQSAARFLRWERSSLLACDGHFLRRDNPHVKLLQRP